VSHLPSRAKPGTGFDLNVARIMCAKTQGELRCPDEDIWGLRGSWCL
jgi:hypothetical protein